MCSLLSQVLITNSVPLLLIQGACTDHIYIYAFSRRFYPKRLTVHSGYTFTVTKFLNDMNINIHIQVHLKKIEYHEKGQYFLSLISESETHILYRFITQSEKKNFLKF